MSSAPIRNLIAEDHQFVRAGLSRVIVDRLDTQIVGEAESGGAVIEFPARVTPHVLLLDIAMSRQNRIDCLRSVRNTHANLPVLVLSGQFESSYAINAVRTGASGCLSKTAPLSEILRAIRIASKGWT